MEREGSIERGDLVELVEELRSEKKWGLLFIQATEYRTLISVNADGLELIADSNSEWELLQLLVQRGYISTSQLKQAKSIADDEGKKIKQVLNDQGFAGQDHFEKAVEDQARESILNSFLLDEADYRFRTEDRKADIEETYRPPFKLTFDTDEILQEARDRLTSFSQYEKVIPDPDEIYYVERKDLPPMEDDAEQARRDLILEEIGNIKSVSDLLTDLNYSRYEIYETLVRLHQEGIVVEYSDQQLIETAKELTEDEQYQSSLRLLKKYLNRNPNDREAAEMCATMLSEVGDEEQASGMFYSLAQDYLEEDEKAKAQTLLKQAYENDPSNEQIREEWFDTVLALNDPEEIRQTGGTLIHTYIEGGDYKRAEEVLERLLQRFPNSIRLSMVGAELARAQQNDPKMHSYLDQAVRELPDDVPEQSQQAVDYLMKAAERPELIEDDIRQAAGYTEWSIPISGTTAAYGSLVLLIGVGLFFVIRYQTMADPEYELVKKRAQKISQQGKYEKAIKLYRDFIKDHPYTYHRIYAQNQISKLRERQLVSQTPDENGEDSQNGGIVNGSTGGSEKPGAGPSEERKKLMRLKKDVKDPSGRVSYDRAMKELSELEKTEKKDVNPKTIEELKQFIRTKEEEASKLLKNVKELVNKGKLDEARKLNNRIREKYARTEAADQIEEPVKFTSVPSSARVFVDGEKIGTTPFVEMFPSRERVKYTALLDFYKKSEDSFVPLKKKRVEIYFEKKIKWKLDLTNPISSRPVIEGETIVATTRTGYVWTGSSEKVQNWSTAPSGKPEFKYLVHGLSDRVFALSNKGTLYVIKPKTSRPFVKKLVTFEGESFLQPILGTDKNRIFAVAAPGAVHVLNFTKDSGQYSVSLNSPPASSVKVFRGSYYVVTEEGVIRKIPADPSRSSLSFTFYEGNATPEPGSVITAGKLFVPMSNGEIYAVHPEKQTAKRFFRADKPIKHGLAGRDQQIVFVNQKGGVQSIHTETGETMWKRPMPSGPSVSPAFDRKMVYTADTDGLLHAYERKSGNVFWSTRLPDGIPRNGLFVTSRYILVGTDEGYLYLIQTRE